MRITLHYVDKQIPFVDVIYSLFYCFIVLELKSYDIVMYYTQPITQSQY